MIDGRFGAQEHHTRLRPLAGLYARYLSLIVLLPLAATFVETSKGVLARVLRFVSGPRALAAYGSASAPR